MPRTSHKRIRRRVRRTDASAMSVLTVLLAILALAPARALMQTDSKSPRGPYEQEFVVTAYYSAQPDQCCYVRGDLEADQMLNGKGRVTADGTAVYAGIVAAPNGYPFGTRIVLPGIGVVTVHDRGGAIRETASADRLDLWVGSGEEGLARALTFGVQRMRGTVYLPGSSQPSEHVSLNDLSAPPDRLKAYLSIDQDLLDVRPKAGDRGFSVILLQKRLGEAGYYTGPVTGKFGAATTHALSVFVRAMQLTEPADQLTQKTAAYLMAGADVYRPPTVLPFIGPGSASRDIQMAERLLRYLGFYRGRTDGVYDKGLKKAIFSFQLDRMLVGGMHDPGAGSIGPLTRRSLVDAWQQKLIRLQAGRILVMARVRDILDKTGKLPKSMLSDGDASQAVRRYQELLVARDLFPATKINGFFGPLTHEATMRYQLVEGLIQNSKDHGAGTVGPNTLRKMRQEEIVRGYRLVRGKGWNAL